MLVLSLQTLIEEAVEKFEARNFTGNILSTENFLRKQNIECLESIHSGIFAFLAFHPGADQPIIDYINAGSLPSDSGNELFVLFMLDRSAKWATPVTTKTFTNWLQIEEGVYPAYELVKILFRGHAVPPLPGIVIFQRFTGLREPVFVSLGGLATSDKVGERLRTVFSIVQEVFRADRGHSDHFTVKICVEFQKKQLPYSSAGNTSMQEWLIRAFQLVWEHKGDLVTTVGLFNK